ncbi:MAG: hypothetical protein KDC44_12720 [Phaeodactylibacter sp.]|nr:hypothetical protein [Phaeodactylibacter sp.]
MKKTKTILSFLLFVVFTFCANAQEFTLSPKWRVGTRIGLNTFSELNLQLERNLGNRYGLEFYLGYNYQNEMFSGGGLFCWVHSLTRFSEKKGPIFKLGLVQHKHSGGSHTFAIEYRNSRIDQFVKDSGCFSGTDASSYSRYDWQARDIGLSWYWDVALGPKEVTTFYLGAGALIRNQRVKQYAYGQYGSQVSVPDPHWSNRWVFSYFFDLGFKINFINIRN